MEFLNYLNILLEWKFHYVEKNDSQSMGLEKRVDIEFSVLK